MRVRVDIPELLPALNEFLMSRGYDVALEGGELAVAGADPTDFQAAISLLADLDIWQAKHPWATARLDPELSER